MTHWISVNDAPRERPMAGRDTATMFESSMIREETSEDVSRTQNPDGAAAWFWSIIAVMKLFPDKRRRQAKSQWTTNVWAKTLAAACIPLPPIMVRMVGGRGGGLSFHGHASLPLCMM